MQSFSTAKSKISGDLSVSPNILTYLVRHCLKALIATVGKREALLWKLRSGVKVGLSPPLTPFTGEKRQPELRYN